MRDTKEQQPLITVYHVFTDEKDLWTQDYRFARKLYNHWKKGHGAARLYRQRYEDTEDLPIEDECLLSYGPYPL